MAVMLDIPFSYTALYIEPKRRNESCVSLFDTMPFLVREMKEDEAPLLAVLQRTGGRDVDASPFLYREIDGVLCRSYSAGLASPNMPNSLHALVQGAPETSRDILAWSEAHREGGYDRESWVRSPFLPGTIVTGTLPHLVEDVREWTSNDRENAIVKLQVAMSRTAFVDGILYVPSGGPAVSHVKVGVLHNPGAEIRFQVEPDWLLSKLGKEKGETLHRFYPHDLPFLREVLASGDYAISNSMPKETVWQIPELEVLQPERMRQMTCAMGFDLGKNLACAEASRRAAIAVARSVPAMDLADLADYVSLRRQICRGSASHLWGTTASGLMRKLSCPGTAEGRLLMEEASEIRRDLQRIRDNGWVPANAGKVEVETEVYSF